MQASSDRAVHVLNDLIETTLDSASGYREAAENTDNPQYREMFSRRSDERLQLSRRLQEEVRTFGGEPRDEQSMMGKMHDKFVELKNAVTGDSDKAVIDEVERGEDTIKAKYEKAMKEEDLPPQTRQLISEAYSSVKSDHDEVSAIKHRLH